VLTQAVNTGTGSMPVVLDSELQSGAIANTLTLSITAQSGDTAFPVNALAEIRLGENTCQIIPGRGTFPTARWRDDQFVTFPVTLTNCADRVDIGLPLTLRWFTFEDGAIVAASDAISLTDQAPPLARAASCPPIYGVMGAREDGDDLLGGAMGRYRIVGFRPLTTAVIGELVQPAANWTVERRGAAGSPADAVRRVYTFRHETSDTQYTCTGGAGTRPPDRWLWGERRFFDGCEFRFQPGSPPGVYAIFVALQDASGQPLPAYDADGIRIEDGFVRLGTITLLP